MFYKGAGRKHGGRRRICPQKSNPIIEQYISPFYAI